MKNWVRLAPSFRTKTGTLTPNEIEFFKCSIAGVSYGTGITKVQKVVPESARKKPSLKKEEIFSSTLQKRIQLEGS